MSLLPSNPTARRRELQHRMRNVEDNLNKLVSMMPREAVKAPPAPAFDVQDVQDLAERLADVARQSGWEGSDNQDGHFGGRGDVIIVAAQR